jgi:hypothetical protein
MKRPSILLTSFVATAAGFIGLSAPPAGAVDDTTAPTVVYIGPSDKTLATITIELEDTNADAAASEVHVLSGETELTPTSREAPNSGETSSNIILLHFSSLADGNYNVKVKPHDKVGNIGTEVLGVVQKGEQIATLNAYGNFQGGAESAAADIDGDGVDEIVTAAGPGGGPHVRVFAVDFIGHGNNEVGGWMAYDPNFHGGVRVAGTD